MIIFELSPAAYVCMLDELSKLSSSAYASVTKATLEVRFDPGNMPSTYYTIQCTDKDAKEFLAVARVYCPDDAQAIEEGIKANHRQH